MATPQLIDHTNFDSLLVQSTNPRGSSPNGNIYFGANGLIQLITAEELANVDLGGGSEANPLTNALGITLRGLYNFENQERVTDETLRTYLRATKGTYYPAGAYEFIYDGRLDTAGSSTGDDRTKIRGSGWIEHADSGSGNQINRIYHGVRSLNPIEATSQPYRTITADILEATLEAATWTDFARPGPIDEAVQVYGDTAFGDTGAGDFDDTLNILTVRVRTFGNFYGETTSVASGINEMQGFSGGYGIGESDNTANNEDINDVIGGGAVSPWTGMALTKLVTPQTETGFNEADGDFTWVLSNTLGGTAQQCADFLDALETQDADIDNGAGTYNGKQGREWYRYNAAGQIVTNSISGEGLFIEGLSAAEKQKVIFTDDAGDTKTYPFFPSLEITVGSVAPTDPDAWYQVFYVDGAGGLDFDTANAVTVNDGSGNPIKGNVQADVSGVKINTDYDYDGNTQAGLSAGVDKDMVVIVEGNGIAGQAITYFTMTRDTVVPVTCAPPAETNA
jgi:hypothetical protein